MEGNKTLNLPLAVEGILSPFVKICSFERCKTQKEKTSREAHVIVKMCHVNMNNHGTSTGRRLDLVATEVEETEEYMGKTTLPEVLNNKRADGGGKKTCVDITLKSFFALKFEDKVRIVGKSIADLDQEAPDWDKNALSRWASYVTAFELCNPLQDTRFVSNADLLPTWTDPYVYSSRSAMLRGMQEKSKIRLEARLDLPGIFYRN